MDAGAPVDERVLGRGLPELPVKWDSRQERVSRELS
jgi:hypothetical protein